MLAGVAAAAAIALAGCGGNDFENEPRPPAPLEVTVAIKDSGVQVSPASFGAGLTSFVIANLGDTESALEVDGPTVAESDPIPAGDTSVLKAELKPGRYELGVSGAAAKPATVEVGPERESSQNQLLLP